MSNSDKTREKLLNSMRKTKAGSENQEKSGGDEAKQQSAKAGSASSADANKSSKQTTAKPKPRATKPTAKSGSSDPYQSRGRVWPD